MTPFSFGEYNGKGRKKQLPVCSTSSEEREYYKSHLQFSLTIQAFAGDYLKFFFPQKESLIEKLNN